MRHLLIATKNRHKTHEIANFFGDTFSVEDMTAHPSFPDVEETGSTFLENATLKAIAASKWLGEANCLALADDSGLEVDALNGHPGVRSARFAGEKASDQDNLHLLLRKMSDRIDAPRTARFRCIIAIAKNGLLVAKFDGVCEGEIIFEPTGKGGFGYDPIFQPKGYNKTFAQLSSDEKGKISHRGMALAQAQAWLSANYFN